MKVHIDLNANFMQMSSAQRFHFQGDGKTDGLKKYRLDNIELCV